ncbi:PDZ domain-containing protein [Streptomyces sp. NPDC002328]|uniref:PDZ domain-containing protein n=1 Tax=Streptomyces sp. NPDC002328 TaxID=3364642 RepID=UPI0036851E56
MEQTALRPKPLPGQEPHVPDVPDESPETSGAGGPVRRPRAARRRGRRLTSLLFGLFAGTVLVLAGVGLGAVGTSVIATRDLAQLKSQATRDAQGVASVPVGSRSSTAAGAAVPRSRHARATLGLEVVDAEKSGARIVAVHVPGPGYSAGLVRGDVLLRFGRTRIDSATDLARAVERARPGRDVKMTVRHKSGGRQQLTVVPGVVT